MVDTAQRSHIARPIVLGMERHLILAAVTWKHGYVHVDMRLAADIDNRLVPGTPRVGPVPRRRCGST
jgi:hypothetical protein